MSYLDSGYRRLPAGWEEHQHRPDFQRRRDEAITRARRYGWMDPREGYTYVRPFTWSRISVQAEPIQTLNEIKVRSCGLFMLYVGLFARPLDGCADNDER